MFKNYISPVFSCAAVFLLSIEIQKALTLHSQFLHTLLLALSIYLLKNSPYIKYAAAALLLCIFIYEPVSHGYGLIDTSQIASLMQSNPVEMKGFLTTIPVSDYLLLVLMTAIGGIYFFYIKNNISSNKITTTLGLLTLVTTIHYTHFPNRLKHAYRNYVSENNLFLSSEQKPDTWTITADHSQNQTVVVVIGESVRKDYLSAYGYPLMTTPFLNQASGLFIDGYVSTSFNTVDSLTRTLTKNDGVTFEPNNSVVTLANKAGFDTTWASNKGFWGEYDTAVAAIGMRSHHLYFPNKGEFMSKTQNDEDLLPVLAKALNYHGKQVIFLHMAGSHEDVCQRLFDTGVEFNRHQGAQLDCYLSSIKRLDLFLSKTYDMVAAKRTHFTIIYFSDHGLTIKHDQASGTIIKHGSLYHQNYEVPFIIMGSEFHSHQYVKRPVSAFDFPSLFADVLGIETAELPVDKFNNPTQDAQIPIWDGHKLSPYSSLPDNDPMH